MSQRIALRCPSCSKVSYRPVAFVRARVHFVCNYCHEVGKIDRHALILALARLDPDKHGDASRALVEPTH